MSKFYNLGLDPAAIPDWGIQEALREIVQNWGDNKEEKSYGYKDGFLTLINENTILPSSVLLVGNSNKRDDDTTVGRHGDGLCSALTVLVREGRPHRIINGDKTWIATEHFCENFQSNLIRIEEDPWIGNGALIFEVEISDEEWNDLIERYLPFNTNIGEVYKSSQGEVLLNESFKGKIYCGGIYVTTDNNLTLGYNFLPASLKLDRDRSTCRTFDIQWITKSILSEMSHEDKYVDILANSVSNNAADMVYVSYERPSEQLKDACHDRFVEKFGENSILADSVEEAQKLKKSGYRKVIFTGNEAMTKLVKSSSKYKSINTHVKIKMPQDYMLEFKDKWGDIMVTEMFHEFEDLIENVITERPESDYNRL